MTTTSLRSVRRSYEQGCGIAVGLDIIGERWTLLVIRELLFRPARFNDLLESLHGISPNLLTERLRFLESAGVVIRRPVETDGRGKDYVLTDRGQALRPTVLALAKWGLENAADDHLGPSRPEWAALAMEAMASGRSLPAEITETYQFEIDDFVFFLRVVDGVGRISLQAPAETPAVTIRASAATMIQIGARNLNPLIALARQDITIEGSADAFEHCGQLLGLLA